MEAVRLGNIISVSTVCLTASAPDASSLDVVMLSSSCTLHRREWGDFSPDTEASSFVVYLPFYESAVCSAFRWMHRLFSKPLSSTATVVWITNIVSLFCLCFFLCMTACLLSETSQHAIKQPLIELVCHLAGCFENKRKQQKSKQRKQNKQ